MLIARQSTARTVTVGPVLDADGLAVTSAVVGDFKISKNGGAPAALNGSATLTHRNTGHYSLSLTTSDLDTVGQAEIVIDKTTDVCPVKEVTVVEEAVYDALFAASAAGYQVPIWAAANSTVNLSGTTVKTATDVEADTQDIQSRLPAGLVAGRMDSNVGLWDGSPVFKSPDNSLPQVSVASVLDADQVTEVYNTTGGVNVKFDRLANLDAAVSTRASQTSLDAVPTDTENAAAVWDRVLTAATHNIANSAGRRLRQVDAGFSVRSGTAQAGSANTITLDSGASSTNDIYAGDRVVIVGGTGEGEHGIITAYNGTTKVATMSRNWAITPDATSEFELVPADVDVESWNLTAVTGDGDWALLQSDADDIQSRLPAALTGDGNMSAQLADAVVHGGSSARLVLGSSGADAAFDITSSGDGGCLSLVSSGANANPLSIRHTGKTPNHAVYIDASTTTSSAAGIYIVGSAAGIYATADAGPGISLLGGSAGPGHSGFVSTGGGGDAHGMELLKYGPGSGASLYAPDGITGDLSGSTGDSADIDAIKAKTDNLPAAPAAVGDIPTAAQNAAAWGASVVGNARTRDMYLMGYVNRVTQGADGLSLTIYSYDDTTVLQSVTETRLATTVGGVRNLTPGA